MQQLPSSSARVPGPVDRVALSIDGHDFELDRDDVRAILAAASNHCYAVAQSFRDSPTDAAHATRDLHQHLGWLCVSLASAASPHKVQR